MEANIHPERPDGRYLSCEVVFGESRTLAWPRINEPGRSHN